MQNPIFVKENKEENSMKKYYDVYFEVHDDCKTGYSVFIEAESEEDPIEVVKREKLYEEEEDLKNIRAVTEISKEQYEEVMKLMELMKE